MGSSQAPPDPVHHEAAQGWGHLLARGRLAAVSAQPETSRRDVCGVEAANGREELGSAAVGHAAPPAQLGARRRGRASRVWLAPLRFSSLPVLASESNRFCTGEAQLFREYVHRLGEKEDVEHST